MAKRRRAAADLVRIAGVGLFVVFVVVPLYWMVITSIKPTSDYLTVPPVWFPAQPTIVHYTAALFSYRGLEGLINSAIIASAATILSTLLGTMMAYSMARFDTGGRHLAFWVLSQRFLPPVAVVLPLFLLFRSWRLYDTHVGLILAYTFMTLPLSVWMMYAYFRQLPRSLEDAALVDGLSRWQALWMVAVPLAAPGIVAAAVFVFIAVWTEFFFALVLTSRYAFTLPTVFRAFLGFQGAQYGEACALATTSLVPSLVLGMLVQRHLVRGLTLGALRG
jgi:multiple sugar transport system permease protein